MTIVAASAAMTFAFAALATAGAFAARFKYRKTGELTGKSTSEQIFTMSAGKVTCKKGHLTGNKADTDFTTQKVKVEYSECSAFGFTEVSVSPAEFSLGADGSVDILNTIEISIPFGFCSVSIPPQSGLKSVEYVNKSGKLEVLFELIDIKVNGSGGVCGGGGSASYAGGFLAELIGGTIEWAA